jgi:hypothetical protein
MPVQSSSAFAPYFQKDLKHNIGHELNKAIAALEDENSGSLEGVLLALKSR